LIKKLCGAAKKCKTEENAGDNSVYAYLEGEAKAIMFICKGVVVKIKKE
jgi:hypothetical protein